MSNRLDLQQRALDAVDAGSASDFVLTSRSFGNAPRKLAVLDSSFNPPTMAHRRLLEQASERFACDHRLLLLAKVNADKGVFGAPLGHRVRMMELLAQDMGNTSVGVTAHGRFVDKARALRQVFGRRTRLFFILGYDTVVRLFDPKYYDDAQQALTELFALADIVYANRAPHGGDACRALRNAPLARCFRSQLHIVELAEPYASMSSTEARRRLAAGSVDADSVVPPAIQSYLNERPFYRDSAQ
jgi:nicotinamide-nucleotide adenylyltransferase